MIKFKELIIRKNLLVFISIIAVNLEVLLFDLFNLNEIIKIVISHMTHCRINTKRVKLEDLLSM